MDVWRNDLGRDAILAYLRRVAPDQLAVTESLFTALAAEEAKWPKRIDEATKHALVELLPQIQALIDYLKVNADQFVGSTSMAELDRSVRYAQVMQQWLVANAGDLLPEAQRKDRSVFMSENLMNLIDQSKQFDRVKLLNS